MSRIDHSVRRNNEKPKHKDIMTTNNTNTVRLHRVLRATPERTYRAFLDADAMAKWLPPNGFTGKVHHLDAKVGGTYKMSFTNFSTGKSHSFGGRYLEPKPHERIRYTDKFDDPNLPGEMQTRGNEFERVELRTLLRLTEPRSRTGPLRGRSGTARCSQGRN
jgi:uncharacterized protein YndB with AHSA1/START domain